MSAWPTAARRPRAVPTSPQVPGVNDRVSSPRLQEEGEERRGLAAAVDVVFATPDQHDGQRRTILFDRSGCRHVKVFAHPITHSQQQPNGTAVAEEGRPGDCGVECHVTEFVEVCVEPAAEGVAVP